MDATVQRKDLGAYVLTSLLTKALQVLAEVKRDSSSQSGLQHCE
jgi:hypothetical protein